GVHAAALVGRDAVREEAGVDTEASGKPFDRLSCRTRLAALDLAHVLLREPIAGEIRLRHSGRDAQLPQPLPEPEARVRAGRALFGGGRFWHVRRTKRHASQNRNLTSPTSPEKVMFPRFPGQPP